MHKLLFASVLVLAGCSETEFNFNDAPPDIPVGGILSGQQCDDSSQTWLEGAIVYTHLYDGDGRVYDTVTDTTDAEGMWALPDMPGGFTLQIYVQYGNDVVATFEVEMPENEHLALPAPACFGDVSASVAVVSGSYDDLEAVFSAVGIASYREINGKDTQELTDFLLNDTALNEFDVIFFNGGHQEEGIIYPVGDPTVDAIHANLFAYVSNGGVVFGSDWAYDVIEQVWPDRIDFLGDDAVPDDAQSGEAGDVNAVVLDSFMEAALGVGQVTVSFDVAVFPVMESVDASTRVYLQGEVPYRSGQEILTVVDAPLAVSFDEGNGRVYYGSYRNSANDAGDMLSVLQYLLDAVQ